MGNTVRLSASGAHSHTEQTKKRLSMETVTSIVSAVRHDVTRSSTEIRRFVSTEEAPLSIHDDRKVKRAVAKARNRQLQAMSPVETGFAMRNTLGSIKQYARDNDMRTVLARHGNTRDSFHLNLHQFFVLHSSFSAESLDFDMFYATPWMLLTVLRVIISEWPLNVAVDLTHRFCTNKVKMIGYGVNTLGFNYRHIMIGTIPDSPGEPASMYDHAWDTFQIALRDFIKLWTVCPDCSKGACPDCRVIQEIIGHRLLRTMLQSDDYSATGQLPLGSFSSDSSGGFISSCARMKATVVPELNINLCRSHRIGDPFYISRIIPIF